MHGAENRQELELINKRLEYFAKHPKLYGEQEAADLFKRITTYLDCPYYSAEQKMNASANVLWSVKKYISFERDVAAFQKDAINIINVVHPHLSLNNKDKENFLNFMVSSRSGQRFSYQSYVYFSDNKINDDYDKVQNSQIFYKVTKRLEKKKLADEEYQKRALNYVAFLRNYAKQVPNPSHELIEKYTHIFFKMAERFPHGPVPFAPYLDLFTRTERLKHVDVKMKNMFGEEKAPKPPIDKKAVNMVLGMYKKKVLGSDVRAFDFRLHNKMGGMLAYIVQTYNYSPKDVKEMQSIILGNGYSSLQQGELNKLGKAVLKAYKAVHGPKKTVRKPLHPFTAINTKHWEV